MEASALSTDVETNASGRPQSQRSQEQPETPNEFLCPISLQLMVDPVINVQTNMVYDLDSISSWLKCGGVSDPLTGVQFSKPIMFRRMLGLQRKIAAWCLENGIPYDKRVCPEEAAEQTPQESCQRQSSASKVLTLLRSILRGRLSSADKVI